jgi:hypothetical protein
LGQFQGRGAAGPSVGSARRRLDLDGFLTLMNRKTRPLRIGALLFLWPFLLPADEPARIPYELIYQIQKTEASLSLTFTNLSMYLAMSSTRPAVGFRDLRVYIDSKGGRIPVELNPTNGSFAVPMRDSLVAERAMLVANQPKGTMSFEWYVGLKIAKVPTNDAHYCELMQPLKDLEIIRAEMKKIPGSPDLAIYGLKLIYPLETDAGVVIHAKSGDRLIKTDRTHTLVIPYEPALLAEDPLVSIPIPPKKVDVADPPSAPPPLSSPQSKGSAKGSVLEK